MFRVERRLTLLVLLFWIACAAGAMAVPMLARAQASARLPSFDVASVKPDDPNDRIRGDRELDAGGRIVYRAYTLRQLIMEAYGLQFYQLSGGPGWADSELFNIEAKPPADSTAAKVKPSDPRMKPPPDELLMLRSLLASRFQLVLSQDQRDGTVYSLEPVAGGVKRDQFHAPEHPDERPLVALGREEDPSQQGVNYNFTGYNATMALLAERLEQSLSAPVKDNTGLAGNFDFVLHYTYDDSVTSAKYPLIPKALQEQFGLRLKAGKGPVEHYVIVHAEQPSAN
jgi:uncharacterized protein (TIGR03435 family)